MSIRLGSFGGGAWGTGMGSVEYSNGNKCSSKGQSVQAPEGNRSEFSRGPTATTLLEF